MHGARRLNRAGQIERWVLSDLPRPLRTPHDRGEIVLHTQRNIHRAAILNSLGDLKQIMGIEFSDRPLADQWKYMRAQPAKHRLGMALSPPSGHFDVPLQGNGFKEKARPLGSNLGLLLFFHRIKVVEQQSLGLIALGPRDDQ